MKTTEKTVQKRRYETSLTKKVLAIALVIACMGFVTYTKSVIGAIITAPALGLLMISVFNNRIHAGKRTNAIVAIVLLTGLLVAALPLISFGKTSPGLYAMADAKPVVTANAAAETTPLAEEVSYVASEDEDSYSEEVYYEAAPAIGGGVAPSAPAPAVTVPEIFTPSEPIVLEPDPVNPVVPVEPLPENNKPVVKLIFDGTPIIYVGEVFELLAKIFDADETDTFNFVGGDVVTSDSNVATGIASQKDADTIAIMVTGNSAGYADISLPEGFVVDSQDGSSDASNTLNVKVMEEVIIYTPEIPLEPETPAVEPEAPVVEPTTPEEPTEPTEPTVPEPTEPTVPEVQEPEVPSDDQSPDDIVFESMSVPTQDVQDTVNTSVEVQTVETVQSVQSVDDSQNITVSTDTVVF